MFSDLAKLWMMNHLGQFYGSNDDSWYIQLRDDISDENIAGNAALFSGASMNGTVARLPLAGNVDITIPSGKTVNYIRFYKGTNASGSLVYASALQDNVSFPSGGTFRVQGTSTYFTLGNS